MNDRCLLQKNDEITVKGCRIRIDAFAGEGSSCLTYYGTVVEDSTINPGTPMVIKEFYPKDFVSLYSTERENGKLRLLSLDRIEADKLEARKKQFMRGYELQDELSKNDVMELVVRPYLFGDFGDSVYIISNIHKGKPLNEAIFSSLTERLSTMVEILKLFSVLHQNRYMMIDIKPSNFFLTNVGSVKLLDTDSIIKYDNLDEVGVEDIYSNSKYCSPQLMRLKKDVRMGRVDFNEKKRIYLHPFQDVYCLALYFFELIFDRIPSEEEVKNLSEDTFVQELQERYIDELPDADLARELIGVLKKAFTTRAYQTAEAFQSELDSCKKRFDTLEIKKANMLYLSYDLIEKYPLFQYCYYDDTTRVLDVCMVGASKMRAHMLTALISCGQMLDTILKVRIVASDAEKFWKEFVSEDVNPDLQKAVITYFMKDGSDACRAENDIDKTLTDAPLAYIYLYSEQSLPNVVACEEEAPRYYICMDDNDGVNRKNATAIVKTCMDMDQKMFVGYLGDDDIEELQNDTITLHRMSPNRKSKSYDETVFSTHAYDLGFLVHMFYTYGNYPKSKESELREAFRKQYEAGGSYECYSSIRCGIHTIYKLASLGLSLESGYQEVIRRFYDMVLDSSNESAKELFERLAILEHRSWTAYMLLTGARTVTEQELDDYVFCGGNDWKDKSNPGHIGHPMLKSSTIGRTLLPEDFERYDKTPDAYSNKLKSMDELDRFSLKVHHAVAKRCKENQAERESKINVLMEPESPVAEAATDFYETKRFLRVAFSKCERGETNSNLLWRKAKEEYICACSKALGIYSSALKDTFDSLDNMLKPVFERNRCRDFKVSDEDLIRAIPELLNKAYNPMVKECIVVKLESEKISDNVFSSLLIRPEKLILVTEKEHDLDDADIYKRILDENGLMTEFIMVNYRNLMDVVDINRYDTWIDTTGTRGNLWQEIIDLPIYKKENVFEIVNRRIKTRTENNLEVYNGFDRRRLTVEGTLSMFGVKLISERKDNYMIAISRNDVRKIWCIYRKNNINNPTAWRTFIPCLQRLGKNNSIPKTDFNNQYAEIKKLNIEYVITSSGRPKPVDAKTLVDAGIKELCQKLKAYNLISDYTMPDDDKAVFSVASPMHEVVDALEFMVKQAMEEPLEHRFYLYISYDNKYEFRDDSLYIIGQLTENDYNEMKPLIADMIEKGILIGSVYKNSDDIINVSLRYKNKEVKELLKKEGNVLEALIYHEAKAKGIFDDLRVNSEVKWPDDATKNEIDVIGTRDGRTYFISAKLSKVQNEYLYEIAEECRHFGIETKAILVSAKETPTAIRARADSSGIACVNPQDIDRIDQDGNIQIILGETLNRIVTDCERG